MKISLFLSIGRKLFPALLFMIFCLYQVEAQVVVIDPGHGYSSTGSNVDGRTTTEIYTALAAGQKLKDLIQTNNCGWTVHMTRTTNGAGGWVSVTQRATMSNNWNATRFISIHCNAGGGTGTETFYCNQSASSTAIDNNFAQTVQDDMVYHGQWTNRRCVEDRSYLPYHLGVLRTNNAPACLSEIGFVDYASDATKLNSDSWRDNFAMAYYTALQDELGTCAGAGSGNLAPQGTLYSVTSELSSSYGAAKAFDGTVSTRWNSNGAEATNYFIIRLDKAYNINEFVVKHASSAGLSSNLNTERYYVFYWSGSAWTIAVADYNNSSKAAITSHNVNVTSQYVCLYVTDPTFTADLYSRIPEFEVYGTSAKAKFNLPPPTVAPTVDLLSDVFLGNAEINALPNMVTNGTTTFVLEFNETMEARIELVDLQGRLVKTLASRVYQQGETQLEMDLTDLAQGVYFYRMHHQQGISTAKKLMIF